MIYKNKGMTWILLSRSLQLIWKDKIPHKNNAKHIYIVTYIKINIHINIHMNNQHMKTKEYCVNNCLEVPKSVTKEKIFGLLSIVSGE